MLRRVLPSRPEARRLLVGTLLSAIGRGLTLPFLFIYLTDVRGLSDARAGLVIGWYGAVTLVLSPLGGTLIDRYGARRVVLPCLLIEAAGVGSLTLVGSTATAFAAASVIAVGSSAIWSGQNTILASLTGEGERQRVFGLNFALLNFGIGVGGVISGAIVDTSRPITFQTIYVLDALSYLAPAVILLTMPAVGRRLGEHTAERTFRAGGNYLTVLRDRPFRRLVVFGLVLTTCGYAQIEVGFTAYCVRVVRVEPRVVAWALAANTVMIVLSQFLMLRRMDGRSRSAALAGVGVAFATSWLILGAAALVPRDAALVAALGVVACATVFGFGETMLSPVMPALTNALASDELRGRYNAMSYMIFGVSGVIGPVTAGPLIGAGDGMIWVLLVTGGCLVASLLALSLRSLLSPAQDGRVRPGQHGPSGAEDAAGAAAPARR